MLCLKTIQNIEGLSSYLAQMAVYSEPRFFMWFLLRDYTKKPRIGARRAPAAKPLSFSLSGLAWFPARHSAAAHNDVVDGDEDQLHGVSNEAHDGETNGTGHRDLLELLGIRLGASLNQTARVHAKLNGTLHAVANWVVLVGQEGRHSRQLGGHCFF